MKTITPLALTLLLFAGGSAFAAEPETDSKSLRIAAQQICPVSGERLGAHGDPIEVRVGKEAVFLCCKACLGKKLSAKHWGTIHTNFAAAQAKCPVMKKPLPKNPKWTIVAGRVVYVCCPPCIAKIEADPKSHLELVDEYYATSIAQRKSTTRR